MKQLLIYLLTLISLLTYGQEKSEKVLYVVDSIPIFQDISEEEGNLSEDIVDHIEVVTTKSKFGEYQIYDFDKLIFVFTKEYAKRPDEIKRIPSFINKMYKNEDKWCLKGFSTPYTGRYIDYYLNGVKKEEGFIKKGVDDGLRTYYYKDGTTKLYRNYSNGMLNGETGKYFANGQLQFKGQFKNGKEDGFWTEWYSTGEVKWETTYKSGKAHLPDNVIKTNSIFKKGLDSFDKGKYTDAVNYYNKAIELNSKYSDVYFHRSRAYLYDLKFDEALADCNKSIEIEPLNKDAYSLRAFIRIRKYEFKDSRTLTQNKEISVYTTKQEIEIPADDKVKICSDLRKGYELGDTKQMIVDAIKKYCE
ncbi:tetratricopeptide repeat protein [Lacihabitans sp. LS3-19]|uniref:tetratricopeptide repeat protein n=1 Tax=Lacihabitans sp. LS3-19 TaxID=2487335 RepID=UPI0020CE85F9|nr:tetratricopeptide repeat protein [Lacihabitans sp. LS3-19]MCP9769632.1 tetratricopeptide repeat protein [Lacihabitans sp. LS3-19]